MLLKPSTIEHVSNSEQAHIHNESPQTSFLKYAHRTFFIPGEELIQSFEK